jgi:hypothetical protein
MKDVGIYDQRSVKRRALQDGRKLKEAKKERWLLMYGRMPSLMRKPDAASNEIGLT